MFKQIGIVGAGTLGRKIAQIAVLNNYKVLIYDVNESVLRRAKELIKSNLFKHLPDTKGIDEYTERISTRTYLSDLSVCDCIFEAVTEDLKIKKDLFKHLDANTKNTTILASTTPIFLITSIASLARNQERIIGLNFIDPVETNHIVEVVKGLRTNLDTINSATEFVKSLNKIPIFVKDSPGFIIGRISQVFINEALKLLNENVASFDQIDKIIKKIGCFPDGPFEYMDKKGIDSSLFFSQLIFEQSSYDYKFRPSLILKRMCEAGYFGVKSGKGFYDYIEQDSEEQNKNKPQSLNVSTK